MNARPGRARHSPSGKISNKIAKCFNLFGLPPKIRGAWPDLCKKMIRRCIPVRIKHPRMKFDCVRDAISSEDKNDHG